MSNVIVLLSGGIDSTACVKYYKDQKMNVFGIHISYNQLSEVQEMKAANMIADYFEIPIKFLTLTNATPKYSGIILGRNAFLIITALLELPFESGLISLGIHSGTDYYDCSESFTLSLQNIIDTYTSGKIKLDCPFINWSKLDIINYFKSRSLPLSITYSCENGHKTRCGNCATCLELERLL